MPVLTKSDSTLSSSDSSDCCESSDCNSDVDAVNFVHCQFSCLISLNEIY